MHFVKAGCPVPHPHRKDMHRRAYGGRSYAEDVRYPGEKMCRGNDPSMTDNEAVTWTAKLVGVPTLTLGWSSTEGKGNELSYLMLPAEFRKGRGRAVPGVLSIFATEKVAGSPHAGLMMVGPGPTRMATIATSRTQFTELVYFVQANRAREFELHAQKETGHNTPIASWAVSIELRNS